MPFTAAHPAIVLPFIKGNPRLISATGLIAGSLAPDFEYFFKLSVNGSHGHTIWGLLYFDIPVGALLAVLFHGVVKNNLIDNLPAAIQSRFQVVRHFHFTPYFRMNAITFFLCCWAGSASHVLWDSFTHNGAYFTRHISLYDDTFFEIMGVRYPLFFVLQHVSTAVGFMVIALYIYFMRPEAFDPRRPAVLYWAVIAGATFSVVCIRFMLKSSDFNPGNFIVTLISGGCLGLIIAGLLRFPNRSN